MTVAADYFARVRPLLGKGLSDRVLAVDDAALAMPVIELLASCMLQHVVAPDPTAIDRFSAWKQPFAPIRTSAAPPDMHFRARDFGGDVLATWDFAYRAARLLRDGVVIRPQPSDPRGIPLPRDKHVMVIGCGSLGSEAVRMLGARRYTLVDDARVTVYNLARQWFGAEEVGRLKVDALATRVDARPIAKQLDARELEALVREDPPDVVLLATGTHHHATYAEVLWRLGIPHVAACCYPQARYFEVSIVSPREHTPCLHCFRGHLYRGPAEQPPISDEVAAFLYQPANHDRYVDLVAEPASKIETLRAAHVLARCAADLLAATRSPWFSRVLSESTTCLLGGNVAGAYGITHPGQVIRLGILDIMGMSDRVRCDVCHREMEVAFRDDLPDVPDTADAALVV